MTAPPCQTAEPPSPPRLSRLGIDGVLVSFGDHLSEPANRAALAFRAAIEGGAVDGVEECTTSLVSTFVRFDPLARDPEPLISALQRLMELRDWHAEALPGGRRLWRLPTVFGGDLGPQLDEAAALAGLDPAAAIASIAETRLRVQTIGFAPGQPYLGSLPPCWDIPRQNRLTERVDPGAVTVAIRQIVLFSVTAPTGWRHIGQTGFRLFRPNSARPFVLRPGDEVQFVPTPRAQYEQLCATGPDGGATFEALP